MSQSVNLLIKNLGLDSVDSQLLTLALTHRSASKENNERLEFLGDSILNFTIASRLYQTFPDFKEGDLSRLRASLVDGDSLARLAKTLGIGDFLRLGGGELKSGGARRESILADAMEAIFGAVYLDKGVDAAQALILRLYQPLLESLPTLEELKDPKTRLQERLQGAGFALPVYTLVETRGKPHEQVFSVRCEVESQKISIVATGRSRRKAEQEAARLAYEKMTLVENPS